MKPVNKLQKAQFRLTRLIKFTKLNFLWLQYLTIFILIFIQTFMPITAYATGSMNSIVDDAPPVDENKPYIPVTADNLEDMTAEAAILIDATTGRILYEKNPDKPEYPASTTKMMTCILALENSNGDDIVDIDSRAVGEDGSSVYLNENDQIKMSELLQATMLASGNDGASAIAYYIGKGSMAEFIKMMNDKAIAIGAENTHFANPNGLTESNHYSTARDLAKIAAYGYKNPEFRKIVSVKEQEIQWVSPSERKDIYGSTNRLLWNYDDVTGIKTGYTEAAGGCLVASAEQNGTTLIAVVLRTMDSRTRFLEGRALLDYGFKHIAQKESVDDEKLASTVYVHDSNIFETTVKPATTFSYLVMKNENPEDFSYQIDLPNFINAPVKKGDKVGSVNLIYQGTAIGSVDLVADEDINPGFNIFGFLHKLLFS